MIIDINPVAFHIPIPLVGWWPIYWYGISWLVAILSINYLARYGASSNGTINEKVIDDFIFYGVLGAIIGGRIGYMIFYSLENLIYDPFSLFKIWEGGLSFHGGLIGVLISFFIFSSNREVSFFQLSDHMAIYLPLGLGSVRVGNFLGGELLGRPTEVPWGIIYSNDPLGLVRHPSQIYEAVFEGIILFIFLNFLFKKQIYKSPGVISSLFLIFYSLFRFFIEFTREPDVQIGYIFFNLTLGQLLSLLFFMFGIFLFFKKNESR